MDVLKRMNNIIANSVLSPNEIALRSDIAPATIYVWIDGKFPPSMRNIVKVCNALDIPLCDFFLARIEVTDENRLLLQKWDNLSEKQRKCLNKLFETFNMLKY